MLKLELVLSVVAVAAAFAFPNFGARWFDRVAGVFRPIAQRQTLSVICVGILAVVARLAVLPVLPIPAPAIHDEFSYLLMADTFAHGRLANPTPPMWEHFETFHENMVPTYVSKYFPAQGAFLAFGQVVLGNPFWGVVLSTALMCAAICWMLQAWISPGWALVGGVLAVIRLAMFSYWNDSYWGGSVAALGGALVLGALPRIKKQPRVRSAVFFALGVGLLFNTRPYESVFFLIPVAVVLIAWLIRLRGFEVANAARSFLLPAFICLVLAAGFMTYYFWRTTGSPFRMPYTINEQMYSANAPFPWVPLRSPPEYRHEALRSFHQGWHLNQFLEYKHHPVAITVWRLTLLYLFYISPALTIPFVFVLVALPYGFKLRSATPEVKLLLCILAALFVGNCMTVYFMQHYWAPATCVIFALAIAATQYLVSGATFSSTRSRALTVATIAVCVVLAPARAFASRLGVGLTAPVLKTWASKPDDGRARSEIETELAATGGPQLVIVGYQPNHNEMNEWVYNGADLEHEKIIWARDMGPEKNQDLIDYYKGRRVWLVEPDKSPVRIVPYPDKSSASPSIRPSL